MMNQRFHLDPECSILSASEIACLVPKLRAKTQKRVTWERNLAIGCDLGTHTIFAFIPNDSNAAQYFRCHILHSRPSDWELWQKNLQKLQNLAWMWMTIHRHLGWEPCYSQAVQTLEEDAAATRGAASSLCMATSSSIPSEKRIENSSRPGYGQYSRRIAFTRRLG